MMVEANQTNMMQNQTLTQMEWCDRNEKLQAEQRWLSDLKEAVDNEQSFMSSQKKQQAMDLRETYKEQWIQKKDCEKLLLKL